MTGDKKISTNKTVRALDFRDIGEFEGRFTLLSAFLNKFF